MEKFESGWRRRSERLETGSKAEEHAFSFLTTESVCVLINGVALFLI